MKAGCFLWLMIIAGPLLGNVRQGHWRWWRDNGSGVAAKALAPQDFPYTGWYVAGVAERLRLRIGISDSYAEMGVVTLQYRCGRGGRWMTISDTVSGHDFVKAGKAPEVTGGGRSLVEWCIKPSHSLRPDTVYQFRLLVGGGVIGSDSPLPELMYRSRPATAGNAGIYRDSLVTGFFSRDSGWIASDGCISIPLS